MEEKPHPSLGTGAFLRSPVGGCCCSLDQRRVRHSQAALMPSSLCSQTLAKLLAWLGEPVCSGVWAPHNQTQLRPAGDYQPR